MAETAENRGAAYTVRKAAAAGQFYPEKPEELRKQIDSFLKEGNSSSIKTRFLISPHAGYVFSGPVAGKGYAVIDKNVKRVIVIGPSHREYFKGIVLPEVDFYQTPLGKVRIDKKTVEQMKSSPVVVSVHGADMLEHSIEVQIPFLQVTLKEFSFIPIIVGEIEPVRVAAMIEPFIDSQTAVIASSDLSHYYPNKKARIIDDASVNEILNGNLDGQIDGCGRIPIKILMHLAQKKGLCPVKLDARTSFDVAPQYGSELRVVGYTSIAYYDRKKDKKEIENGNNDTLSTEQKKFLLNLARENLNAAVRRTGRIIPEKIPEELKENLGCFVTLKVNGMLRGCIGYIEPIKPLYEAIIDNASNAALRDPRFTPVQEKELGAIQLEVSVLSKPVPFLYADTTELLQKLIPEFHGVILYKGGYQSTFLPQVWEQLPDKVQFLEHLAVKAGLPRDAWKTARYEVYTTQHFNEANITTTGGSLIER